MVSDQLCGKKRLAPYWVNTAENSILKDALRERGTTFEKEYNKLIETGEITTVVSLTTAYYEHQSDASLWGIDGKCRYAG